jgi:hypothetical protein
MLNDSRVRGPKRDDNAARGRLRVMPTDYFELVIFTVARERQSRRQIE